MCSQCAGVDEGAAKGDAGREAVRPGETIKVTATRAAGDSFASLCTTRTRR